MALTPTYQRVAHALDWLVKVWRDPADNSTVQAVILVDTDGNPTTSGGGGDASAANQVAQTALLTTIDADTTTIIDHVDGIEALLTTIDTSLNNIEATAGIVAINQSTPGDTNAIAFQKPRTSGLSEAIIDTNTTGDNTLISATVGQTSRVFKVFLVSSAATTIIWKDGTTGLTGAITVAAGGSFVLDLDGDPWFTTSSNSAFILNQSGTAQLSGRIYYVKS